MTQMYWEDFEVGREMQYGGHVVTEEEIIEFGREFDPQPFHVDPVAAMDSPYGGLIASGWQTAGFCMRMMVDNVLSQSASIGSPGVESLRWRQPVRVGDTLHVHATVLDRRASASRPEMGFVKNQFEVRNQHDEVVLDMVSQGMFGRRPSATVEAGASA